MTEEAWKKSTPASLQKLKWQSI